MKTVKIFLFAATLAAATSSKAQLLKASSPASENSIETIADASESSIFSSSKMMATKAGFRAVKNFNARFKDHANARWCNEKNVISASFNTGETRNTVVYDKKGNWIRNMKTYYEDQMPKDIRATVKKSNYFDDRITLIQEIEEGDLHFYVVHLEGPTTYKQVAVYEGEIRLLSKFDKQ
jgi:hypothetical protein